MSKPMSDYEQFAEFAKSLGCVCVGEIGTLCSRKAVRVEEWTFPTRHGFVLMTDKKTGKIGIYSFVGEHNAPLIRDIEWLKKEASK